MNQHLDTALRALLLLLLNAGFGVPGARAQALSNTRAGFNGRSFSTVAVRIEPEETGRFSFVENTGRLAHRDFVRTVPGGEQCVLINASVTDATCQPLGYYVVAGTTVQPPNLGTGEGNFYMQPNGAFVVTATDVVVTESANLAALAGVRFGVQSGPMLVRNGAINAAFNPASPNRFVRCGVGVSGSGSQRTVHFVVANEPVTFYELAAFFAEKLQCPQALCLESAGCVLYFPGLASVPPAADAVICRYIRYSLE